MTELYSTSLRLIMDGAHNPWTEALGPVEKDIPAPALPRGEKWGWLKELEVGDSRAVFDRALHRPTSTAIGRLHQTTNKRFMQRKQPDGSLRVWRMR